MDSEEKATGESGSNNPGLNEINESKRESTRPGFLGGSGGGEAPAGLKSGKKSQAKEKSGAAKDELDKAEDGASKANTDGDGGLYRPKEGINGAREEEEKAGGLFSGGKGGDKKKKGRGKGKFSFRKSGPITGSILAIFIFGAMSISGVSPELIAWKENATIQNGQNSAVMNSRSNYIMRKLLTTNQSTTSSTGSKYKISTKLSNKLKEQNINYVETDDASGKKVKLLLFEDSDGSFIPIVASNKDVDRVKGMASAGQEVDIDGRKVKITDFVMTLADARKTNKNFMVSYDTATITFTGKIAGWFDNMTDSLLKRIIGDKARNQTDIDDPDKEKVDDMLLGNKSEGVDNSEVDAYKERTDEDGNAIDKDGNPVEKDSKESFRKAEASDAVLGDENGTSRSYGEVMGENAKLDTDTPDNTKVSNALSAKAQKAAMLGATAGCAFLRGIGAISTAVGAIQTINVINYASKYLELADKIKAGDADEVVNLALENLNTPTTTLLRDIDDNEVEVTGAVTESDGWNAAFSTTNIINENDPSALMVNREYANKNALRNATGSSLIASVVGSTASFGAGVAAFKICNSIQLALGSADAVSDFVLLFTTAGIGNFVKEFIKGVIASAVLSGVMIAITSVVSAITPMVAKWFANHLTDAFLGKTGGYSLQSGVQNIFNSNLQMSTGRYATNENAVEVFGMTKDIERQWAAYDRTTLSPFDVTSQYTFLGSIVNSILPVINSTGGKMVSTVSSVVDLAGSAAVSMISPSAKAANDVDDFALSLASEDHCSYLGSVGVAGDFACNKYSGAYVNELTTLPPEEVYDVLNSYGSFDGEDSNGNPKIKKDSDYAKFIVACVSSDTQPGTMNAAVEGFIQKSTTTDSAVANGLINFGMNFVPFEGLLDAVDAVEQGINMKWNSGMACTGSGGTDVDDKVKWFSMYNLDQRVLYDMGVIDSNSTVSFLEEYYEENPLDQSFEGQIARVSGMTKEQVEDTLALIEYYEFIAEYKPSERYAFGASEEIEDDEPMFDNENALSGDVVLLNLISFADVRNRTFVV